jgi:hypothetical protein
MRVYVKKGTDAIKPRKLIKINQKYIEAAQIEFCYKWDLTEMSTRNLPEGKGRPERKADLTDICEPIV